VEQRCRDRQALKIEGSRTVFLSYASEDVDAARRICEALRAAGVEVWFDQSELRGGDAWEHEIRGRIRECTLFIPVISCIPRSVRRGSSGWNGSWRLTADRLRQDSGYIEDRTDRAHALKGARAAGFISILPAEV
jgi:hypothetical protein